LLPKTAATSAPIHLRSLPVNLESSRTLTKPESTTTQFHLLHSCIHPSSNTTFFRRSLDFATGCSSQPTSRFDPPTTTKARSVSGHPTQHHHNSKRFSPENWKC
jgi:hypothetical protein